MRLLVVLCFILLTVTVHAFAGKKLRVLFIGNSYTYHHNMPQMVADMVAAPAQRQQQMSNSRFIK